MERWRTTGMILTDLFDVSLLNANILNSVGMTAGAVAKVAEVTANDQKCNELGWSYLPLAVETYGSWGREPGVLLASRVKTGCPHIKQQVQDNIQSIQPTEPSLIARAIILRST